MKIRLAILVRVLGFLLGGIVAVVAAVALLLWASFDAERTGQTLVRHFKDTYQRSLQLSQPPQLVLWPRPALSLQRVTLTEPGRSEAFASANRIRLDLAIWPLLQRHIELSQFRADGLSARLFRSANGEWNFADLLKPVDSAELPHWKVALSEIQINEARLAIENQAHANKTLLSEVSISARLPAAGQTGRVHLQGKASEAGNGTDLKILGSARLSALNGLSAGSIEKLSLSLEGNSHELKGVSTSIGAQRLAWADHGASGQLSGLEVTIHGAYESQSVDLAAGAPELEWQGLGWKGQELKARLALRTVTSQSEFNLRLPQLKPDPERGFITDEALLSWQQRTGTDRSHQGQLNLNLQADLSRPSLRASRFTGQTRLEHPRLLPQATNPGLSGNFVLQAGASEFTLNATLGEDQLQTRARLSSLWPLIGRFDLTGKSLDLDRLLAEPAPDKTLPPFEWPQAGKHQLSGSFKLDRLRVRGLDIQALHSPLQIEQAQLKADGFTARLHGGTLSGKLLAEPEAQRISVQGDFKELPLERLALETELPIPLSGKLTGSYRLSTLLKPRTSPLTHLEGAVRWSLSGAGLRGLDLQRSLKELSPAITSGQMSARRPGRDETTELGSASSRFVFTQGRLSTDKIETRSSWLKMAGTGQADLMQGEMDFHLQAELLPGASRELSSLRGKTLPLRLKGPLMHPDLRYEPTKIRPTLATSSRQ